MYKKLKYPLVLLAIILLVTMAISVFGGFNAVAGATVANPTSTSGAKPSNTTAPITAPATLASGKTVSIEGIPTVVSSTCLTCHGKQGISASGSMFPNLAGQWAFYIRTQLYEFKSHQRADPLAAIMWGMVAPLSAMQIDQVAAYFSKQIGNPGANENPNLVEAGKKIYTGGLLQANVPACMACHGPTGIGIPPMFPALAGQRQAYVINQLNYFKSGVRTDDPEGVMRDIAKNLTSKQITELAAYARTL
ncbi:MAG: c-type cytochrome [Sulfuriferula sp.]